MQFQEHGIVKRLLCILEECLIERPSADSSSSASDGKKTFLEYCIMEVWNQDFEVKKILTVLSSAFIEPESREVLS